MALMAFATAQAADKSVPVDEDFLEYLGTVDDEEDWNLFADKFTDKFTEGTVTKPATDAPNPAKTPHKDDRKSVPTQTTPEQK